MLVNHLASGAHGVHLPQTEFSEGKIPLGHIRTSPVPSGTYANVTPAKHFVYDSGTLTINGNNVPLNNTASRLVEAYTGPATAKITDIFYSYSARGEVTDVYQSSPNSGGFYHVNASYWPNGVQNTLNANLSGLPSWTYSVDGEGRWTAVADSNGGNPVTSTSYNVFSKPTAVNFGSLDSDAFNFDPNTGRMTLYQANVGSATISGALTWNKNGSLYSLGITDSYNANNNQTCTYAYDDFARLSSVNCGSSNWGQSFTYDPFGNITKSGSNGGTSFSVSYSWATNQITSSPYLYDANGNLTADGNHAYTWDAEGKLASLDGNSETYDAKGRRVEQLNSGAYTEILYAPSGAKLALMNGTTVVKMFVPLPAGAVAVYTGTSLSYYRHPDWLGSSRIASTPSQTVYYDGAYAPFGESYNESGTTDRSFTGQNQDLGATDLYDFLYREHSAIAGRWINPDPSGKAAVDPTLPQTWNGYAYVSGDPLRHIDQKGLFLSAEDCIQNPDACLAEDWPAPGGMTLGSPFGGAEAAIGDDVDKSSGSAKQPVKCTYTGHDTAKPSVGKNGNYGSLIWFNFSATGGDGQYVWGDTQEKKIFGSVIYRGSTTRVYISDQGYESLQNVGTSGSLVEFFGNSPNASFFDAPGFQMSSKVKSGEIFYQFTLNVEVDGAACPTVNWSISLTWPPRVFTLPVVKRKLPPAEAQ